MALVTRAVLRDAARVRGDLRAPHTTDAEVNTEIDRAHRALRSWLSLLDEQRYATLSTISVIAGTQAYALPADYDATLAVSKLTSGGRYTLLRSISLRKQDSYDPELGVDGPDAGYALRDGYITMWPTPTANATVRHWYVPQPAALASDSATVDLPGGAEDWIAYDAAIPLVIRAGRGVNDLVAMRDRVEARIRQTMARRDRGSPRQIEDTRQCRGGAWRR